MARRYFEGYEDSPDGARGHTNLGVVVGRFIPVLMFGGNSVGITYSSQLGWYTQIDGLTHIDLDIVLINKGSSTGNATIGGLPFPGKIGLPSQMFILGADYLTFPASEIPKPRLPENSTIISLVATKSNSATTVLTHADFANNTAIEISGSYPSDTL